MEIKPDYWIIKIDERRHWCDEVKGQTTANYGVYAFNRNSHTHCAELTPSYDLTWVSDDYEEIEGLSEEQRNDLNEMVLTAHSEPGCYMWVMDVERIMKEHPERCKQVTLLLDLEDLEEGDMMKPFYQIQEGWSTGAFMY